MGFPRRVAWALFQMPAALPVSGRLGLGGGSGDLGGCRFSESVTVPPAPGIRGCQRGRRAITERVSESRDTGKDGEDTMTERKINRGSEIRTKGKSMGRER